MKVIAEVKERSTIYCTNMRNFPDYKHVNSISLLRNHENKIIKRTKF